jgi:hypothetical protein
VRELIDFYTARLDEQEQAAFAASPGPWIADGDGVEGPIDPTIASWYRPTIAAGWMDGDDYQGMFDQNAVHIALHDPAAVLADVAAKRKLLDAYTKATANKLRREDAGLHLAWTILGSAVRTLAEAQDEHLDYQEEWRP